MSHLKTLLTGAARRSVQGLGYSGDMFSAAWSTLERKFGQPHLIISAQLSRIQSYPTMRYQDSKSLVEFADIVSNYVAVPQQFRYSNDLFSSSNLEIVTGKVPLDMRRKSFGNIEKPQNRVKPPSLMDLNTWIKEQAIVHERVLSSLKTSKYDPVKPNADSKNRDQKDRSSNFEAVVSDKRNTNQCPLQDGVHRIWQCEAFKKKCIDDRYETVKEKKLCF